MGPSGREKGHAHPWAICLLALGSWLWFVPPVAVSQPLTAGDVVLEDTLSVDHIGRSLYAFDSSSGGQNKFDLDLREKVIFQGARGRVGLVVTNRRLLAIAAGQGGWRVQPLRLSEQGRSEQWISSRVALVVTPKRIIGFDAGTSSWLEVGVGPNEVIEEARVGSSTAIVLTGNNAYGLSPAAGGFFVQPLQIHEKIESVSASGTIGRVLTSQRLLIFKAGTGAWTVTERPIH